MNRRVIGKARVLASCRLEREEERDREENRKEKIGLNKTGTEKGKQSLR